eukprot:Skav204841  [mRNA]  locus=scaffold751:38498:38776:+ [translate_table: standard]
MKDRAVAGARGQPVRVELGTGGLGLAQFQWVPLEGQVPLGPWVVLLGWPKGFADLAFACRGDRSTAAARGRFVPAIKSLPRTSGAIKGYNIR